MTAIEPKTHSEGVYASLRAELLGGAFLPGSKLRLAGIGTRYGVSLSVVREAMTRMAERITIISAERVRDELVKLINGWI